MRSVTLSASLLSANFASLGEEVKAIEPFVDMIHLDIMDGHFVPNLTFGPVVVSALRSLTRLPFDAHLMVSPADPYLAEFAQAGVNILTVHVEACAHADKTLRKIKELGCQAGIAISPDTPADIVHPFLPLVDLILVMTVRPGFAGQSFLEEQLEKISHIRSMIDKSGRPISLEVDGGISPITAPLVVEAGADILVASSAIFKGGPSQYIDNIEALRSRIDSL